MYSMKKTQKNLETSDRIVHMSETIGIIWRSQANVSEQIRITYTGTVLTNKALTPYLS